MNQLFTKTPLVVIAFLLSIVSCQHDDTTSQDEQSESQIKKLDVVGHVVKGDSIRQINKDLNLFLSDRFEERNRSSSEDITSNAYGFTITTNRVLQLSGDTYTNYIFNVSRDNPSIDGFENYMLTIFNDGRYMQVLIYYPFIDSEGGAVADISSATVTYINDATLLTGVESSPCANTSEEIIEWSDEADCIYFKCTAGGNHSYGQSCSGSPGEQPFKICYGGWVVTGCTSGGGSSSGSGSTNPTDPFPPTGNGGNPTNPVDPNNPNEEVPTVPLIPAWQEVVNCLNGGAMGSFDNSLPLSSNDINWLKAKIGTVHANAISNFIDNNGCSLNINFLDEAVDVMILENISLEEFIKRKVEELLIDNPLALLEIDCNQLQYWQTLAQHTAPQWVQNKINNLPNSVTNNFYIQYLNNAGGTAVNMDYFSVKVTNLPIKPSSNPPTRYTADEFLDYIRRDINNFVDDSTFEPYCEIQSMCQTETDLWNSDNPVGSIVYIDIPGDDGVVVCSEYTNNYWHFMTMNAPYAGNHPVSGTRQFGYETNADGSYNFFVRGVDRFNNNSVENLVYIFTLGDPFSGADSLWESFQTKIENHVNNNFGSASKNTPVKNRPDWNKVKDVLKGKLPISELGCNN